MKNRRKSSFVSLESIVSFIPSTAPCKPYNIILTELADENSEIIISQRKISAALHISKGTVSRNLRRLRDGDYINVYPMHHSDGGRATNKYVIR